MYSPMLISIIFLHCRHLWDVFVVSGFLPCYERCFSGVRGVRAMRGVFPINLEGMDTFE